MNRQEIADKIKRKAIEIGFVNCGISKSEYLESESKRLEKWLNRNMHGNMAYMENHFEKRLNPGLIVEGAKSVISVLDNYFPSEELQLYAGYKISKYAYGEDYHRVLKDKLFLLLEFIKSIFPDVKSRCFTDSAPILEKAWASKSGIGWIGKNGNLITPKIGSFYFLGEIVIDEALPFDEPISNYCGTCTRCIEACPTEAIVEPYVVDGSKCISYLTIELKSEIDIPNKFKGSMDNWIFGCDVCQDVCPWNRFSKPSQENRYQPNSELGLIDLLNISSSDFTSLFRSSPIARTGYDGLKRNILFIQNKNEA